MEFRLPEGLARERREPPGWLRWAALGGGVVVAALVVVLVAGVFSARRMLSWGLRRVTAGTLAALPADVPAARREELRRRLECVVRLAESGGVDERRLGELARACRDAARDHRVTPDELGRIEVLAGGLCALAGGELPN
ncbi:MAG TPA: hypothetical protein VMT19_02060 [Thermoanaerobaculaceae bacterium]|nr:hypothetical protein [Thermoanaerobaculaceae bacterium]